MAKKKGSGKTVRVTERNFLRRPCAECSGRPSRKGPLPYASISMKSVRLFVPWTSAFTPWTSAWEKVEWKASRTFHWAGSHSGHPDSGQGKAQDPGDGTVRDHLHRSAHHFSPSVGWNREYSQRFHLRLNG